MNAEESENRVLVYKPTVIRLINKFSEFYGLLCSQEPAIGPYPETVKFSLHPEKLFFKIHFNIIIAFKPGFPE
jgi:hypothetical protein